MKKAERMEAFVQELGTASSSTLDPCYRGYFQCFNEGRYYEAHDVLEHLWLQCPDGDGYTYFKGLIQIAGAFVHLQKQFLRPAHPKDGARLRPAVRLFRLGMHNLERFRPRYMEFDVESFHRLAAGYVEAIERTDYSRNPWHPDHRPQLTLAST